MSNANERLTETVTLSEAKSLVQALAHQQSLLLLSPPGAGKSETIAQAAQEAGLECRSLLGTQIAPEDVSGIPRIVGERSVFCPPRILLPERPKPFCLFLDELPACSPDIQKAFYSLLLERRIGEHFLPKGTWVVAAGNRAEDRALVRSLSSALVNRVTLLQIRVDTKEWLQWAARSGVRREILSFITWMPAALMRPVPREPIPFSTPRAWASLSRAMDLTEQRGLLSRSVCRALAFGTVSPEDAAIFTAMRENEIHELAPLLHYLQHPGELPSSPFAIWFLINRLRDEVERRTRERSAAGFGRFKESSLLDELTPTQLNAFLGKLPSEILCALLVDHVAAWGALGADETLIRTFHEVTGL